MQGGTWLWAAALVLLVAALAELFQARAHSTDAIMHLSWRSQPDGVRREIIEPVTAALCAQFTGVRSPRPGSAISITCDPK